MKRRAFLSSLSGGAIMAEADSGQKKGDRKLAGLDTYTPPLTKKTAYHLLRRTTFGPTPAQVEELVGKTATEAVQMLLGSGEIQLPDPPGDWTDTQEENPLEVGNTTLRFEIEGRLEARFKEFSNWWLELMRTSDMQLIEKLTHFWSMTWTINFHYDTLALVPTPLIYRNNQTIRGNSLSDYKEMVEGITLDGAMLLFQSLYYSTKDVPNENFMREVMELFTMGISYKGQFNYTEGDIKEGSRVLTGWRTACYAQEEKPNGVFNTYFKPDVHDIGEKTFMGVTIPARDEAANNEDLVKEQEVRGLINILFEQRGVQIGSFIGEKIYNYFVYSSPGDVDTEIVDELAQTFVSNNYDMRKVFEKVLTSQHFFDEANMGVQIKTPPEFIVGVERQLGVKYSKAREAVIGLEQILYDPPNVAGWDEYRSWISTKTFPLRVKHAKDMLELATDDNLINVAKALKNYDGASEMTAAFEEYLLPVEVDTTRHNMYMQALLTGANVAENQWQGLVEGDKAKAAAGIRNLILTLIHAPDFQLC